MNDEPATGYEVTTFGVSISADRADVAIYLGGSETDKTFELTMPMDLAMHMASTIRKLASLIDALSAARRRTRR